MRVLQAESATRSRNAPLHTFDLAQATALVFAHAGAVPSGLWADAFGDQPKDFAYYDLLERTMAQGFAFRYLVLAWPNGKPFALQPLIIVDQDLSISLGGWAAPFLQTVRRFYPRCLRSRMMLAGCLVGNGHFGVSKKFSRRKAINMLPEALLILAEKERTPLLTIKDFPALERSELQPLRDAGFTRLDGFPPLKLELDFATFEQYQSERLSKITRKGLRRKFRAAAAATPPITLEVRKDCHDIIDEIYPLYLAVTKRSTIEFEVFTREYFLEASLTMPERCCFFIWRQGDRIVAFSYCTVWNQTIFDNDIGLDYSVAHRLHLYHRSFRDIVEWALRHGYRYYRTAPFNYDPKLRLRLELDPVDLFVRHRSIFLNFLIRHFAPRFSPALSDPVLRRHLGATS